MLPDLKTFAGLDVLREAGYRFSFYDQPQQFKMQAKILDLAVKTAGSLTSEAEAIYDTSYFVLDSLLAAPQGFEFFRRFPKEEVAQFCRLAVVSREQQLPLPIVCPVCPDYPDYPELSGYSLGEGIGYAATRVLKNLETLFNFFNSRNFSINLQILVADVEMLSSVLMAHSGETQESFLAKTQGTQNLIRAELERMGVAGSVSVDSMLAALTQSRFDYSRVHEQKTEAIILSQASKVRRVKQALLAERISLNNFGDFNAGDQETMVVSELADYAAFGEFVGGRAVILSPDAVSAVPAYNFLRTGQEGQLINPTIFLKNVKMTHDNYD